MPRDSLVGSSRRCRSAEVRLSRSSQTHIGSVDPDALKIPARRAEYSLTENAPSPFHAEPEHSEYPSIPVILVSGYADIAQTKLPNSGFEFVQLPFHPATLLSAVKKAMRPKSTPS